MRDRVAWELVGSLAGGKGHALLAEALVVGLKAESQHPNLARFEPCMLRDRVWSNGRAYRLRQDKPQLRNAQRVVDEISYGVHGAVPGKVCTHLYIAETVL